MGKKRKEVKKSQEKGTLILKRSPIKSLIPPCNRKVEVEKKGIKKWAKRLRFKRWLNQVRV